MTSLNMAEEIILQLLAGDDDSNDGGSRPSTARPGPRPRDPTEKFIDAFREEECLWNERRKKNKDKLARQLAIERIADSCEMDERDVRAKINNLRSYYVKALHRVQKAERLASQNPETSTPVKSTWPYFERIDFLREHYKPYPRKENVLSGSSSSQSKKNAKPKSRKDAVDEDDLSFLCEDDDSDSSQVEEDVSEPSPSPSSKTPKRPPQQSTSTQHSAKKKKKTPAKKIQNTTEDSWKLMATNLMKQQKEAEQTAKDPDETFGKHIAHELRNITDQRCKQYVKMEIQKLLFEAQWGNVPSQSGGDHQTSPDPSPSTTVNSLSLLL